MLLLPTNIVPIFTEMIYVHVCLLATIHCHLRLGKESCEGKHLPTLFQYCLSYFKNYVLIVTKKMEYMTVCLIC